VLYSLVILVQKFGTSVTAIIVLPILDVVGFNPKPHATNTPEAIFGLQMCYLFAPGDLRGDRGPGVLRLQADPGPARRDHRGP